MSDLIEEIIELIDALVRKRREIVSNVKDVRNEAEKHHRDSNIAKSVGATAAAIGGVTAIFTGGLSLVVAAGVAAAGAATSIGTTIADPIKSKQFLGKIREIADSQKKIAEKLKEKLDLFNKILSIYARTSDVSEDVAMYTIVRAIGDGTLKISQQGVGIAEAVVRFKEERQAAKAAKAASTGARVSRASFQTARSTVSSFGSATSSVARGSVQAAKAGGSVTLKVLSRGLLVVSIGWDVVDVIHSWTTDHPTVKTMNDLIENVEEGIDDLKKLKADFREKQASVSDSDSYSYSDDDSEYTSDSDAY